MDLNLRSAENDIYSGSLHFLLEKSTLWCRAVA